MVPDEVALCRTSTRRRSRPSPPPSTRPDGAAKAAALARPALCPCRRHRRRRGRRLLPRRKTRRQRGRDLAHLRTPPQRSVTVTPLAEGRARIASRTASYLQEVWPRTSSPPISLGEWRGKAAALRSRTGGGSRKDDLGAGIPRRRPALYETGLCSAPPATQWLMAYEEGSARSARSGRKGSIVEDGVGFRTAASRGRGARSKAPKILVPGRRGCRGRTGRRSRGRAAARPADRGQAIRIEIVREAFPSRAAEARQARLTEARQNRDQAFSSAWAPRPSKRPSGPDRFEDAGWSAIPGNR